MSQWTVHLKDDAAPVLVREGFSLGALVFGPLWFAAHRAWVPAAVTLLGWAAIDTLTTGGTRAALQLGLALLQGVSGHDLRRWSLARRGYVLAQVVVARGMDAALARLFARRPDLASRLLKAGAL